MFLGLIAWALLREELPYLLDGRVHGPLLVGRPPALDRAGVLADLAAVTLDGEEDAEGEPYDVSNDETFDTLSVLVRRARAGLANGRFGDRP